MSIRTIHIAHIRELLKNYPQLAKAFEEILEDAWKYEDLQK
jgi:hypothetical protein